MKECNFVTLGNQKDGRGEKKSNQSKILKLHPKISSFYFLFSIKTTRDKFIDLWRFIYRHIM